MKSFSITIEAEFAVDIVSALHSAAGVIHRCADHVDEMAVDDSLAIDCGSSAGYSAELTRHE